MPCRDVRVMVKAPTGEPRYRGVNCPKALTPFLSRSSVSHSCPLALSLIFFSHLQLCYMIFKKNKSSIVGIPRVLLSDAIELVLNVSLCSVTAVRVRVCL